MTRPEALGTIAVLCLLALWLIGILKWSHRREARRRERSGNPYQAARRRGFWYGLIIGASLVGVAWRIWR